MKILLKSFAIAIFALLLFQPQAFGQAPVAANSVTIFDIPQGVFNPLGKFTSIGNSGGVIGPTPLVGCDLYGFRAQTSAVDAINMGMEQASGFSIPTISFTSINPLVIEQQFFASLGGTSGNGSGLTLPCGKALAWYFDSTSDPNNIVNDIVYNVAGSASASGVWLTSDRKLKTNIVSVTSPMNILNKLNGVTYDFRRDEFPELNLSATKQYGFIAQEVQQVMPEAVQMVTDRYGDESHLAINYDMVIPVLTEAVKSQDELLLEQNEVIKEQQTAIETLTQRLARLEKMMNKESSSASLSSVSLGQNRPNPVSGMTTIDYEIPSGMKGASFVVYSVSGAELHRMYVAEGKGSINYDASNLSNGVYFYAIEFNGNNMARQKMVVK